ncbi:MAG: class I SAM-dependent RNA methyltransferase [Mogibacterium kristiansenii]|uniref:THUMP domain-containing class I SAM-dependent RNA methyltransferase n=1 Tax=Mogibacterium kristiansenii TaxID=2606708 RepID=UPI003F0C11E5
MKLELIATATFGLEAVVKREIQNLGYTVIRTEDGRVTYQGDERAIVRSNLWLRTADRVYLRIGELDAKTFEELFQQIKGLPWEKWIPVDGAFPVVGTSVKSTLHSVPSCQSIIKKAIVSRLSDFYCVDRFEESGAEYRVRFSILKDHVTVMLDTSGSGLHKRGYRVRDVAAPMKETLAAALVQLSYWKDGAMRPEKYRNDPPRMLVDTCCGSGTILIEAAMMARNIAPGLNRSFAAMKWDWIPESLWKEERKKAFQEVDYDGELLIKGFDIDERAVEAARENAEEAGVGDDIRISKMDMKKFRAEEDHGIIITNPPYGERIGDDEKIQKIYRKLADILENRPTWSLFLITTDKKLEESLGRKADRRRKLYNGRLETQYYQFHSARPGKE